MMNRFFGALIGRLLGNEKRLTKKFNFGARSLTAYERQEARRIFGEKLDYDRVRILEGANLPNFVDDIGRFLKKMPKREVNVKNAITLGNNCLFGRQLKTDEITDMETELTSGQLIEMSWLVHELTHAWQFQTLGWKYLFMALDAQRKLGAKVYDFGGEEGLKKRQQAKAMLKDFNMEQQGHLVQKYYEAVKKNEDTSVYEPFVQQILT
jgi:hypothetical protein